MHELRAVKYVKSLLDEYASEKTLTPTEFIEHKFSGAENNYDVEFVAKTFVCLHKHKDFLEKISQKIIQETNYKSLYLKIILYFILFDLNRNNMKSYKTIFFGFLQTSLVIIQYLKNELCQLKLVKIACSVYDNEYVLKNVITPLLENSDVIQTILDELNIEELNRRTIKHKVTIPQEINVLRKNTPPAPPPSIDDLPPYKFKARDVPLTTYQQECLKELEKLKTDNKQKALDLLKKATEDAYKCSELKPRPQKEVPKLKPITPKPAPKINQVQIKATAASLMREAAHISKEKCQELKQLEDLIAGAFDTSKYEKLEEEIRTTKEQQHIQDIERKHLQGLLTYEEAILAKQNAIKLNQDKMLDYHAERVELLKKLDNWKLEQEKKNKNLITKAQMIEQAAKEAESNLKKAKRCNAKLLEFETSKLLEEAYKKQDEELKRKIELIQELKALQRINAGVKKEFDKTETAHLGLLCEMSIAELQERLNLLRLEMEENLEERKRKIIGQKERQRGFLENVKNFIDEAKASKVKEKRVEVKLQENEEILDLREKLMNARRMRQGSIK